MNDTSLKNEVWYEWKQLVQVEGENFPRLLNVQRGPDFEESVGDYCFESVDKATECLESLNLVEEAIEDEWILAKVTYEPLVVDLNVLLKDQE